MSTCYAIDHQRLKDHQRRYFWIGLKSQKIQRISQTWHPIPTRHSKVSRLIKRNRTTRPTGPTRHSSFVTTAVVYSFKPVSFFAKEKGEFWPLLAPFGPFSLSKKKLSYFLLAKIVWWCTDIYKYVIL